MAQAVCSDEEFIEIFRTNGAHRTAKILKVNLRAIYNRRIRLEKKYGINIRGEKQKHGPPSTRVETAHPERQVQTIEDGILLLASDAHYWPGDPSTAHRAFVHLCKKLKPKTVVMNGDAFDGASISRHPSIGWEQKPTVIDELQICQKRMQEIANASGNAALVWTLGNHDQRFENRLANNAPEFAAVNGMTLKDHFPQWTHAMSFWINNALVIFHNWKGGVHGTFNNVIASGMSVAVGHTHNLHVRPYSNLTGVHYSINSGTLCDIHQDKRPIGKQFAYVGDRPVDWRSGFIVITFKQGRMLYPETVYIPDPDRFEFRGEVHKV